MEYRPSPQQTQQTITSLQNCAEMCQLTYTLLLQQEKGKDRTDQLRLLQDCRNICNLCLNLIKRNSSYAQVIAFLCSFICFDCEAECLEQTDYQSKVCAQICHECGLSSRIFSLKI